MVNKGKRLKDELWDKFERHLLNEGITKKRINKINSEYSAIQRGVNYKLGEIGRKEIEDFVHELNTDKFLKKSGEPYSGTSKQSLKKFLRQFFKWYKGENEFYPKEISWLKARISKDEEPEEKPAFTLKEVVDLANSLKNSDYRLITLLLFDTGFRIGELLSVKKRDLKWEPYGDVEESHENQQKCWWMFCNESKTEKRKIPIPIFTEEVNNFVNTTYFRAISEDDLIFNISYDSYRKTLNNTSLKLYNRKFTPHCLRHSSATHYATELEGNSMALALRYGWTFNSSELKTYIKKSGFYQKLGAKKVYTNEISKLKEENVLMKKKLENIEETMKLLIEGVKMSSTMAIVRKAELEKHGIKNVP